VETLRETDLMIIDRPEQQPEIDWKQSTNSDDNVEIERITCKSRMYHLIDGVLYRQGTNGMMMRCISTDEGNWLLQDIHSGVCRAHSSLRSIVGKAFQHGFY
jgi:hypothetical protein